MDAAPSGAHFSSTGSIIAFVNGKSGGQLGQRVISKLKKLIPPHRVYDLMEKPIGPMKGLVNHTTERDLKIICCGGDGTVGWVLSVIDEIQAFQANPPCVSVIPLGTGNDLSRILRWGTGYGGEDLTPLIDKIIHNSHLVKMDRWRLVVTDELPPDELLPPPKPESAAPARPSTGPKGDFRSTVDAPEAAEETPEIDTLPDVDEDDLGLGYGTVKLATNKNNRDNRKSYLNPMGSGQPFFLSVFQNENDDEISPHCVPSPPIESQTEPVCPHTQPELHRADSFPTIPPRPGRSDSFPPNPELNRAESFSNSGQPKPELTRSDSFPKVPPKPELNRSDSFPKVQTSPQKTPPVPRISRVTRNRPSCTGQLNLGHLLDEFALTEDQIDPPTPHPTETIAQCTSQSQSPQPYHILACDSTTGPTPPEVPKLPMLSQESRSTSFNKTLPASQKRQKLSPSPSRAESAPNSPKQHHVSFDVPPAFPSPRPPTRDEDDQPSINEGNTPPPRPSLLTPMRPKTPLPAAEEVKAEEPKAVKPMMINNYFSLGIDSKVALDFHTLRNDHPGLFSSKYINMAWYAALLSASRCALLHATDIPLVPGPCLTVIELDGKVVPIPRGIKAIVLLNIPSYGGGSDPWGPAKSPEQRQSINDKRIEVVGLKGAAHVGRIQAHVSTGIRIGQATELHFFLKSTVHAQADGEPFFIGPASFRFEHFNQANMLFNNYGDAANSKYNKLHGISEGDLPTQPEPGVERSKSRFNLLGRPSTSEEEQRKRETKVASIAPDDYVGPKSRTSQDSEPRARLKSSGDDHPLRGSATRSNRSKDLLNRSNSDLSSRMTASEESSREEPQGDQPTLVSRSSKIGMLFRTKTAEQTGNQVDRKRAGSELEPMIKRNTSVPAPEVRPDLILKKKPSTQTIDAAPQQNEGGETEQQTSSPTDTTDATS